MSWLLIIGLKNAVLIVPLALAALAAGRLFRRPALAHVLWVLVLVKLITPPLVDVPVGWSIDVSSLVAEQAPAARRVSMSDPAIVAVCDPPPITTEPAVVKDGGPLVVTSRQPAIKQKSIPASKTAAPRRMASGPAFLPAWFHLPRTASEWLFVAGCAWLIGSAVTAARLLRRAWLFQRFLRLAARKDPRLVGRVKQLAHEVGLKTCPTVVVVEGVVAPALWGLGRSVQLVFPARLAARLSASETDALILHELAHYARGDYWVRLLELVAHVAYWWHPVVWWARREIESAEEECCDGWVVERQRGTPLSYAEAILTTIDFLCEPSTALPPAACGLGDVPLLRSRLTCIMRGQLGGQLSRTAWIAVLGAGIILSPVAPAVFATSSRERTESARPLPRNLLIGRAAPVTDAQSPASAAAAEPTQPATTPAPQSATEEDRRPVSTVYATAKSPNGKYTLEARTFDEVMLRHDELPQGRLYLNSNRITCAAFSPDSQWFVTGHQDGALRLWDSHKGSSEQRFQAHAGPIASVAFDPAGTRFAAGASDGTLSVWDLATRQEIASLNNLGAAVSCIRWSPRGDRLAVALGSYLSISDASLIIWSPDDAANLSEESLAAPIGALDWLSDNVVLLADWAGVGTVHYLDGSRPDQLIPLHQNDHVAKNMVSEAHFSPNFRLILDWSASDLLSGAE